MSEQIEQLELTPRGSFSLRAAAEFGFGPNAGHPPRFDGTMRLAFAVDGGHGYAGAVLSQPDSDGPVAVALHVREGADAERALRQVARIVSLDHDGLGFVAAGARDPVLGALQRAHPGQRPVLFPSPYEGAAWSIISARRPAPQAAKARRSLAAQYGATFELGAATLHAFPQPERLIELPEATAGLNPTKVARLHGVARAALEGRLDPEHLHTLGPEPAYDEIQRLNGIGPFYAGLIVLRASGFADAMLAVAEPRLFAHVGHFYHLPGPPSLEQFATIAQPWRPYRTWASVLIRLAGDRGTRVEASDLGPGGASGSGLA